MDGPLDFESEDPLGGFPVAVKKRKKVINLDDLLADHYDEKRKDVERANKQEKAQKNYNSDADDDGKEALFSKKISECHDQMEEMGKDEEITMWGVDVFGSQQPSPIVRFPKPENCSMLQSFLNIEFNNLAEINADAEEEFLEGLMANGWLSKLVLVLGYIEKSIAKWAFDLMVYSPKEKLMSSAYDLWQAILMHENKAENVQIRIEWLPDYSQLKEAIEIYGFQQHFPNQIESSNSSRGPPKNIQVWIKFTNACFRARSTHAIFSVTEAEELIEVIICLCLDRLLQGLLVLLYECMGSAIAYLTDDEWISSCGRIAKSVARRCRVPVDLNSLRMVECVRGKDSRSSDLRSTISYQILLVSFGAQATNEEEALSLLIGMKLKDKDCDLFLVYVYLLLTENWLLFDLRMEGKPAIFAMWATFLRNCTSQISSADQRPFALKVRAKSSYLLSSFISPSPLGS